MLLASLHTNISVINVKNHKNYLHPYQVMVTNLDIKHTRISLTQATES
jgi:hypothetical protein